MLNDMAFRTQMRHSIVLNTANNIFFKTQVHCRTQVCRYLQSFLSIRKITTQIAVLNYEKKLNWNWQLNKTQSSLLSEWKFWQKQLLFPTLFPWPPNLTYSLFYIQWCEARFLKWGKCPKSDGCPFFWDLFSPNSLPWHTHIIQNHFWEEPMELQEGEEERVQT